MRDTVPAIYSYIHTNTVWRGVPRRRRCRGGVDGEPCGGSRLVPERGWRFNLFVRVPHENRVRFKTLIFRSCPRAFCTLYAICMLKFRFVYNNNIDLLSSLLVFSFIFFFFHLRVCGTRDKVYNIHIIIL